MTEEAKKVYLAVLVDRHNDDQYHAFFELEHAIAWCDDTAKTDYPRYEFVEDEDIVNDEWMYCLDSHEDGPKLWVRVIELS